MEYSINSLFTKVTFTIEPRTFYVAQKFQYIKISPVFTEIPTVTVPLTLTVFFFTFFVHRRALGQHQ